jgi:hypothetical protein
MLLTFALKFTLLEGGLRKALPLAAPIIGIAKGMEDFLPIGLVWPDSLEQFTIQGSCVTSKSIDTVNHWGG